MRVITVTTLVLKNVHTRIVTVLMVHHFELRDGIISFFHKLSSTEGRNKGSPEACLIFHSCVKQGLYKFVGMDMGKHSRVFLLVTLL